MKTWKPEAQNTTTNHFPHTCLTTKHK